MAQEEQYIYVNLQFTQTQAIALSKITMDVIYIF